MNSAIERLHRDGKAASEIYKILRGSGSRSDVFKDGKRFEKSGSTQTRVRRMPERPVRTKKLIKNTKDKLRRNPA